uniref:Uncharacterized protein n=1 Tax=Marseillevirus LCMAC202 TaxID=2506606 RepID=A0A481YZR6_9VIRU|nr:MAG: hypothetical protein LCMAC202_03170 [Marseillevirus LCMAC202]
MSTRSYVPPFGIKSLGQQPQNSIPIPGLTQHPESAIKIPIIDLHNNSQGQVGDIVLNSTDSLLYYHIGRQWIPLAIMDNATESLVYLENIVIKAPNSGNICLVAGNNAPAVGGNVHISAGQGGFADGEIYLDIGGDRALSIEKTADVTVNAGNLVVKSGNLELKAAGACINCQIARTEVTAVVVQDHQSLSDHEDHEQEQESGSSGPATITIPEATLNGMTGILTVNLELCSGEKISGVVHNELLREDSWVNVTCVGSDDGVPHVWLSNPQNNSVTYHIYCLAGELNRIELHFDVRNT